MIVKVAGIKVYYEAAGEGTPVLLLHGWGTDSGTMRPVLKQIREALPRRVFALDFPGFGYSDPPPGTWGVRDYTQIVMKFMDGLGMDKADLVAHSFGGRVAIYLASEAPERVGRLALVDSAGIRPERTASYRLRVFLVKSLRRLQKTAPGLGRFFRLDHLVASQGSEDYRRAGALRATFVKVVNEDLSDRLNLINCPTMLIWGERDDSTPLSDGHRMHALIRGSQLTVIEGAGHFPFLEQPAVFGGHIIPFLRGET